MAEEKKGLKWFVSWLLWRNKKEDEEEVQVSTWAGSVADIPVAFPKIWNEEIVVEKETESIPSYEEWKMNPTDTGKSWEQQFKEQRAQEKAIRDEKYRDLFSRSSYNLQAKDDDGELIVDQETWEVKKYGVWEALVRSMWRSARLLLQPFAESVRSNPIVTGAPMFLDYVLNSKGWTKEDYYAKKIYKQQAKEAEVKATDPNSLLNKNKELNYEELGIEDPVDVNRLTTIDSEVEEKSTPELLAWNEREQQLRKKVVELASAREIAEKELRYDEVKKIDEELESIHMEYIKNRSSYATETPIDWVTYEEIFENMRLVPWWANLNDQQILDTVNKKVLWKISEIQDLELERQEIVMRYNERSDKNIVTLTPNSIVDSLADLWVLVSDEERDEMFVGVYWEIPMMIEASKKNGTEIQTRKKSAIVNDLVEHTFSQLILRNGDTEAWYATLKAFMNSPEMINLTKKVLTDEKVNDFFNENGWFDHVAFWEYLKNSDEWFAYAGSLDVQNAEMKAAKKFDNISDWKWMGGKAYRYATAVGYNVLFKDIEQGYPDYVDSFIENWPEHIKTKSLKLAVEQKYGSVSNPFISSLKKQDPFYAQSAVSRTFDGLETVWDMVANNPWQTAAAIWTMALTRQLQLPARVANSASVVKAVNNINSPVWRNLTKMGMNVWLDTVEWAIIWWVFDSFWWAEADPTWMFLDAWIGALRSVGLIENGIRAWFIKNQIDSVIKNADLAKLTPGTKEYNSMFNSLMNSNGLGGILAADGKLASDFIKDGKIQYGQLDQSIQSARLRALSSNSDIQKTIQESNLASALSWENPRFTLQQKEIDHLYGLAEARYGEAFEQVLKNNTVNGKVNKLGVAAQYVADQTRTAEQLSNLWVNRWLKTLLSQTGITKPMDDAYTKIYTVLDDARKTANPTQTKLINEAEQMLKDVYSENRMLPLYFTQNVGPEKLSKMEGRIKELNNKLRNIDRNIAMPEQVTDLFNLPKEIIDNLGDPQKLSEIIFANEKKYNKVGIKTYDAQSYIKNNNTFLEKQIGKVGAKRVNDIISMISDLNNGQLRIYELPENVRSMMAGISGFTTFIKNWEETSLVIGSVWGLVSILWKWSNLAKQANVNYIKTLSHELGHTILLWLKPNVRKTLFKYINSVLGEEVTQKWLKSILGSSDVTPERIKYLTSWSLSQAELAEEVAADLISQGITSAIFWAKGNVSTVWEAFMKSAAKWQTIMNMAGSKNPFEVVGKRFVAMVESLHNAMGPRKSPKDLQGIMYYLAANILEWNKKLIDTKWATRISDWATLAYREDWMIHSWLKSSQKKLNEFFNKYPIDEYEHHITTREAGSYMGFVVKREVITTQEPQKYYAYRDQWWRVSTLRQGISKFDIAKLYSENLVRDMLFDTNVTAEVLWSMLPLSYADELTKMRILNGVEDWSDIANKFDNAIAIAQTKQGVAIELLSKFWEDWIIDLTKKIDWKTFVDALYNISARVSKDGAVNYAWQDLMKFLNASDKEVYGKIVVDYMNMTVNEAYDAKVIDSIIWLFDQIGVKWNTFGDKYLNFVNTIEKKIVDASIKGWIENTKDAEDIAKDVVSRLTAWWPWYLSILHAVGSGPMEDVSKFLDELAFGLVMRNKNQSDTAYYNRLYDSTIRWFDDKGLDSMRAEVYSSPSGKKDISLGDKTFQRQSYQKDFFNYLSARSEEFLIQAIKNWDISTIKMEAPTFAKFVDKVSFGMGRYEKALRNRMNDFGVDASQLDLLNIGKSSTGQEIVGVFQDAIRAKEKLIRAEIGDKKFDELMEWLEDMAKSWLSKEDTAQFISDTKRKMNSFWEELSVSDYFSDISTKDEILESRETNREAAFEGLTPTAQKNKEISAQIKQSQSPQFVEAVLETTNFLEDYAKNIKDIRTNWFDWAAEIVVKNDLLEPFFNIKWKKAWLKVRALPWTRWSWDRYSVEYVVDDYGGKEDFVGSWLRKFVGATVNPATVAEANPEVAKVLQETGKDMAKHFFVFDGPIKDFFTSIGESPKYMSKKWFMEFWNREISSHVKQWWLSYADLSDDIANAYIKKYHKQGVASYGGSNLDGYQLLVDSYVELLWKRHKQFWLFPDRESLKTVLNKVGWVQKGRRFQSARSEITEMDKILWLGANRLSASTESIAKLDKVAALYHKSMFNNFLYSSFAYSDETFNWIDNAMKIGRKIEKWAASAMYAMFYSVLGTGFPAMAQQAQSNMIHIYGRMLSEIWSESIDNIDDLMRIADELIPSELTKLDVLSDLAQMAEAARGPRSKFGSAIDKFLGYQSWLTRADKSMERSVKQYSLTSALLEKWYTGEAAEWLVNRMIQITEEYAAKWYDQYFELNRFIRYGSQNTLDRVSYLLTKKVEDLTMTADEARVIMRDLTNYNSELSKLREITENARLKTITFYQMAHNPDMVQNVISGWAGTANMRFLNWASRKAGEYSFKLVDPILRGDRPKFAQGMTQMMAEWMRATKVYMLMDNAADGWVDYTAYLNATFLPLVTLSMTLLNIPQELIKAWVVISEEEESLTIMSLFDAIGWVLWSTGETTKERVMLAPMYWLWQVLKIANGRAAVEEKNATDQLYSNRWTTIPLFWAVREIFANIVQQRIGRFNTDSTSGQYRDYTSNSSANYFLNFMSNQMITNDVVGEIKQRDAFYRMVEFTGDSWWFALALDLVWYRVDRKIGERAFWEFYKEQGLDQFNWGVFSLDLFDQLERQIDGASIEKALLAQGIIYSEVQEIKNQNMISSRGGEQIPPADLKSLSDNGYQVFDVVLWWMLMTSTAANKALLDAWMWVTAAEREKFAADQIRLQQQVIDEITAMEISSPWLIKAAAYDPAKIDKMINSWLNRFGEQQKMGIIMRAASNANKAKLREQYKQTYGKDRYTKNSKTMEFKTKIEQTNAEFDRMLLGKIYNTTLLGNQSTAQTLQLLYTNTSEKSPMKNEITTYSAFGTRLNLSLIEKNIASQWLWSMGVNNPAAERTARIFNRYDWLDPENKEKYRPKLMNWVSGTLDNIDKYADPMSATNAKVWLWATLYKHIAALSPEVMEKSQDAIKDFLDRVTVSQPLTDEKIMEDIRAEIFKTPGTGGKKKARKLSFNKLNHELNKLSDFKTDFYRYVLKEEPLEHIKYKNTGTGTILPIRMPAAAARPPKAEYNFMKPTAPTKVETPDLVVERVKTTKSASKYSPKSIKWGNVYIVKTSKWAKR